MLGTEPLSWEGAAVKLAAMLDAILISDEEMDSLPEGIAGFLAYEALCREKLQGLLARYSEGENDIDARISYLTNVLSAAEYFAIPTLSDLVIRGDDNFDHGEARIVARQIQNEVTKLRFQALREKRPTSVVIPEAQRTKLEHLIEQLRQRVKDSDLDEAKRNKLEKKIDELLATLRGRRASFRDTMVVLASIAALVSQAEGALIRLPEAVAAVLEVLGFAQQKAEQEALEDKRARAALTDQTKAVADLNDEIPF